MSGTVHGKSGNVYEMRCEQIDVSSNHRPDISWKFTDAAGHEHRWYDGDKPAERYSPSVSYTTPTLKWVFDRLVWWDDDDKPHEIGHLECVRCSEKVEPRYTADMERQFIAGLRRCYINGREVTREEFALKFGEDTGQGIS